MPAVTILFSGCLIGLGLVGYFGSGRESVTALIPAFFGLLTLICGFLAYQPLWRKHVIHIAVVLALLGFLGTAKSYIDLAFFLRQNSEAGGGDIPARILSKVTMATLCLVFILLSIRSFIQARRNPKNV